MAMNNLCSLKSCRDNVRNAEATTGLNLLLRLGAGAGSREKPFLGLSALSFRYTQGASDGTKPHHLTSRTQTGTLASPQGGPTAMGRYSFTINALRTSLWFHC